MTQEDAATYSFISEESARHVGFGLFDDVMAAIYSAAEKIIADIEEERLQEAELEDEEELDDEAEDALCAEDIVASLTPDDLTAIFQATADFMAKKIGGNAARASVTLWHADQDAAGCPQKVRVDFHFRDCPNGPPDLSEHTLLQAASDATIETSFFKAWDLLELRLEQ